MITKAIRFFFFFDQKLKIKNFYKKKSMIDDLLIHSFHPSILPVPRHLSHI